MVDDETNQRLIHLESMAQMLGAEVTELRASVAQLQRAVIVLTLRERVAMLPRTNGDAPPEVRP